MKEINRKKIKTFFYYNGGISILIALLSFSVYYVVLSSIDSIKPYEQISIFSSTFGIKDDSLKDELSIKLKEKGVVEVNIYNYVPNDTNIADYFDRFGLSSDFNILPESDLVEMKEYISSYYVTLTQEVINRFNSEAISNLDYYSYQSNQYGFKIYDKEDETYNSKLSFDQYFDFVSESQSKESYYLLLSKSSLNFGPINEAYVNENGLEAADIIFKRFSNE